MLTIKDTDYTDTGTYELELQNSAGKKKVTFDIAVLDTPGPCSDLEVGDVTKTTADLSWEEPDDDGGCTVLGYQIEKKESGTKVWTTSVAKVTKFR